MAQREELFASVADITDPVELNRLYEVIKAKLRNVQTSQQVTVHPPGLQTIDQPNLNLQIPIEEGSNEGTTIHEAPSSSAENIRRVSKVPEGMKIDFDFDSKKDSIESFPTFPCTVAGTISSIKYKKKFSCTFALKSSPYSFFIKKKGFTKFNSIVPELKSETRVIVSGKVDENNNNQINISDKDNLIVIISEKHIEIFQDPKLRVPLNTPIQISELTWNNREAIIYKDDNENEAGDDTNQKKITKLDCLVDQLNRIVLSVRENGGLIYLGFREIEGGQCEVDGFPFQDETLFKKKLEQKLTNQFPNIEITEGYLSTATHDKIDIAIKKIEHSSKFIVRLNVWPSLYKLHFLSTAATKMKVRQGEQTLPASMEQFNAAIHYLSECDLQDTLGTISSPSNIIHDISWKDESKITLNATVEGAVEGKHVELKEYRFTSGYEQLCKAIVGNHISEYFPVFLSQAGGGQLLAGIHDKGLVTGIHMPVSFRELLSREITRRVSGSLEDPVFFPSGVNHISWTFQQVNATFASMISDAKQQVLVIRLSTELKPFSIANLLSYLTGNTNGRIVPQPPPLDVNRFPMINWLFKKCPVKIYVPNFVWCCENEYCIPSTPHDKKPPAQLFEELYIEFEQLATTDFIKERLPFQVLKKEFDLSKQVDPDLGVVRIIGQQGKFSHYLGACPKVIYRSGSGTIQNYSFKEVLNAAKELSLVPIKRFIQQSDQLANLKVLITQCNLFEVGNKIGRANWKMVVDIGDLTGIDYVSQYVQETQRVENISPFDADRRAITENSTLLCKLRLETTAQSGNEWLDNCAKWDTVWEGLTHVSNTINILAVWLGHNLDWFELLEDTCMSFVRRSSSCAIKILLVCPANMKKEIMDKTKNLERKITYITLPLAKLNECFDIIPVPVPVHIKVPATNAVIAPEIFIQMKGGLDYCHPNISDDSASIYDGGESFFTGNMPRWDDFKFKRVVIRNSFEYYVKLVKKALEQGTKLKHFILPHFPGAGGTTLGRYLLWKFHSTHCCVWVKRVYPNIDEHLTHLGNLSKKPLLIVSDRNINSVEHSMQLMPFIKNVHCPVVVLRIVRENTETVDNTDVEMLEVLADLNLENEEVENIIVDITAFAPDSREALRALQENIKLNRQGCSLFLVMLTAFNEKFLPLSDYVETRVTAAHSKNPNCSDLMAMIAFTRVYSGCALLISVANRIIDRSFELLPASAKSLFVVEDYRVRGIHHSIETEILKLVGKIRKMTKYDYLKFLTRKFINMLGTLNPKESSLDWSQLSEFEFLLRSMFHARSVRKTNTQLNENLLPPVFLALWHEHPSEQQTVDDLMEYLIASIKPSECRIIAHLYADKAKFSMVLKGNFDEAVADMKKAATLLPGDRTISHIYGTLYLGQITNMSLHEEVAASKLLDLADRAREHFTDSIHAPLGNRENPDYPYISNLLLYKVVLKIFSDRGTPLLQDQTLSNHEFVKSMLEKISSLLLGINYYNNQELCKEVLCLLNLAPDQIEKKIEDAKTRLLNPKQLTADARNSIFELAILLTIKYDNEISTIPQDLVTLIVTTSKNVIIRDCGYRSGHESRVSELQLLWKWSHHCNAITFEEFEKIFDKYNGMPLVNFYRTALSFAKYAYSKGKTRTPKIFSSGTRIAGSCSEYVCKPKAGKGIMSALCTNGIRKVPYSNRIKEKGTVSNWENSIFWKGLYLKIGNTRNSRVTYRAGDEKDFYIIVSPYGPLALLCFDE